MSSWARLRRALTPKTNDDTHITVMQRPSQNENENEAFELTDPAKNPHEARVDTGEESSGSSSEEEVYPDVQASVADTDEDVPVNTFRAWFLGVVSTIVLTGLNQFFQLHSPPRKSDTKRASKMCM